MPACKGISLASGSVKHAVHRERWPCYGDGFRCHRPRSGNGFNPGGRSLGAGSALLVKIRFELTKITSC